MVGPAGVRPRMRALLLGVGAGALFLTLGSMSCTGGDAGDKNGTPFSSADWQCEESVNSCECLVLQPDADVVSAGTRSVSSCLGFQCCMLSESPTDYTVATCSCHVTGYDCAQQAQTRRDTKVVDACPPGGSSVPQACAATGENCEPDYLFQSDLEGCCAGSICESNTSGIHVCRAASPEEEQRSRECTRAAYSSTTTLVPEQSNIVTSHGTFALPKVERAEPLVGPGGCVTGLVLKLSSGAVNCQLNLTASAVDGQLRVTAVQASLEGCAGYLEPMGHTLQEVETVTTLSAVSIDMISCDWGAGVERYCTSGRVDFQLNGTQGNYEFLDTHLALSGVACAGDPKGQCLPM